MTQIKLGNVQMRIMQVLWDLQKATAREITEELNELYPDEPIAHSTVQTLLRGLMDKAAIRHQTKGRTFVFEAALEQERVRRSATQDLLTRVFGGSVGDLVSFLLSNENVSKQELEQIKKSVRDKSDSESK